MQYLKTRVIKTDSPEVQKILSGLNAYSDLLLLSGQIGNDTALEVNYLTPKGDVVKIGELPEEILVQIEDLYSDDVWIDIVDFGVHKRNDGTYRLWVGLELKEESKKGELNLPLIIGVGALTGLLTLLVVAVKVILHRKKSR